MATFTPLPQRLPATAHWGAHWGVRLLLLVAVLLPTVGCGAVEVAAGATAAARSDVLTCRHEPDHHAACEQAARPLAVTASVQPATGGRPLPLAACSLTVSAPDVTTCSVAGVPPPATMPSATPGGPLLLSIGVARR